MFKKFVAVVCSATFTFVFIAGCATGYPALGIFDRPQDGQAVQENQDSAELQSDATQTGDASAVEAEPHPALHDPSQAVERAPETYQVKVETTKGSFVIDVTRNSSPNGADRFYNLVKIGYFEDIAIFRAIPGFMFQFGIHGDPAISAHWSESNIDDDPNVGITNAPGTITFAKTGLPNSRSTQMFLNLGDNAGLDRQGFTPFGSVSSGMDVVRSINTEYGENKRGADVQGNLKSQGNEWVRERYPNLDYITSITLIEPEAPADGDAAGEGGETTTVNSGG